MIRYAVPLVFASLIAGAVDIREVAADTPTKPVVKIVDFVIDEIVPRNNKLVAHASVTLDIAGRVVTKQVKIPIRVDASEGEDDECDVLNLAIGPLDLNLLGLVVELDDCLDGPVTVDITAHEGEGLLGDLLCSIATDLLDGEDLGDILDDLSDDERAIVLEGLTEVANDIISRLLDDGTEVTDEVSTANHKKRCDILTLAIPEGLELVILGLEVQTSGICLDIYAVERGNSPLGKLLCDLTRLLDDDDDDNERKIEKIVRRINRLLDRNGL